MGKERIFQGEVINSDEAGKGTTQRVRQNSAK